MLAHLEEQHRDLCAQPIPRGEFKPDPVRLQLEGRIQSLHALLGQVDEIEERVGHKRQDLQTFLEVNCTISERNGGLSNTGKDFGSDISGPKRDLKWRLEDTLRQTEHEIVCIEEDQRTKKAELRSRLKGLVSSIEGRWELLWASSKMQQERVLGVMMRLALAEADSDKLEDGPAADRERTTVLEEILLQEAPSPPPATHTRMPPPPLPHHEHPHVHTHTKTVCQRKKQRSHSTCPSNWCLDSHGAFRPRTSRPSRISSRPCNSRPTWK